MVRPVHSVLRYFVPGVDFVLVRSTMEWAIGKG